MATSNPAIAKFADTNYQAFCARLEQMAADFAVIGDEDRARENRVAAAVAWNAGRKELTDPAWGPVACGICRELMVCDWDVHTGRRRLGL